MTSLKADASATRSRPLPGGAPAPVSRQPLLGLGLAELEAWAVSQGQPAFRGRQLHDWIYSRGARDLADISVLPKAWREQLGGAQARPASPRRQRPSASSSPEPSAPAASADATDARAEASTRSAQATAAAAEATAFTATAHKATAPTPAAAAPLDAQARDLTDPASWAEATDAGAEASTRPAQATAAAAEATAFTPNADQATAPTPAAAAPLDAHASDLAGGAESARSSDAVGFRRQEGIQLEDPGRGQRDLGQRTSRPGEQTSPGDPHSQRACIGRLPVLHRSNAADGTVKLLLGTSDGLSLETVGIPSADRLTVCVSSQVGCPMACRFCATGKGGLQRSLAVHEIVDQVLSIREAMDRRPSHVVFMGMGEPLLNIDAVLAAIDCLCRDLGMAQRQITLSTVGVPSSLPTLADLALQRLGRAQFTLAVSLHAPDQPLRQRLIPTAHAYPIDQLLDDCRRYVARTGRRVSFEYILLGGVNDQPRHAQALAQLLRGFQSHVNLIPYNPIAEEDFRRPTPEAVELFRRGLQDRHIAVSVRASRGLDADAACGQLRRRLAADGRPAPVNAPRPSAR